jgi:hypothetical protein
MKQKKKRRKINHFRMLLIKIIFVPSLYTGFFLTLNKVLKERRLN